jgi:hypothetical protein
MAAVSAPSDVTISILGVPPAVTSFEDSKVTSVWVLVFAQLSKRELARLQTTCRRWCIESRQAWRVVHRGFDFDRLQLKVLVLAKNKPELSCMLPNKLIKQFLKQMVPTLPVAQIQDGKEDELPPSHRVQPKRALRNLDPVRDSVAGALLNIWTRAPAAHLNELKSFLEESGEGMPYMTPLLRRTFTTCQSLQAVHGNAGGWKTKVGFQKIVGDLCLSGEVGQAAVIAREIWNKSPEEFAHKFSIPLIFLWRSGYHQLALEAFKTGMEQGDMLRPMIQGLINYNLGHHVDELIAAVPDKAERNRGFKYKAEAFLTLSFMDEAREAASKILDEGATLRMVNEALIAQKKMMDHLVSLHFQEAVGTIVHLQGTEIFPFAVGWLAQYCWPDLSPLKESGLHFLNGTEVLSLFLYWNKAANTTSSTAVMKKGCQEWLSFVDIAQVIESIKKIDPLLDPGDFATQSVRLSNFVFFILEQKSIDKQKRLHDAKIVAANIPIIGFRVRALHEIAQAEPSSSCNIS